MPKRKLSDQQDDVVVPLPIQTFFWRQTSPFIRPKIGKLIEATCVSFERVVVQNIVHGLSPQLSDAISSVHRWRLIEAAFPHIMHCCGALLALRKQESRAAEKFSQSETKLLYTLHWVMLDAAEECEDDDRPGKPKEFLFSLTSLQLFVYLFAPLMSSMKQEMFQSFRLENGLKLWQPLWEYRQPDIPCLSALVKPKKTVMKGDKSQMRIGGKFGGIFVGRRSPSEDFDFLCYPEPPVEGENGTDTQSVDESQISAKAPLCTMSEICGASTFSEGTSTLVEIVCEFCNTSVKTRYGENQTCRCGKSSMPAHGLMQKNGSDNMLKPIAEAEIPVDKDFVQEKLDTALQTQLTRSPSHQDPHSATFFDVAVLRCLFVPQWAEEGVFWALQYLYQRLQEMKDEDSRMMQTRQRSTSLPMPKITVSLYETPQSSSADLKEPLGPQSSYDMLIQNEKPHKKVKTDIKSKGTPSDSNSTTHSLQDEEITFTIGGKILAKPEETETSATLESNIYDPPSRPRSALAKLIESSMRDREPQNVMQHKDGERRRSLPSAPPEDDVLKPTHLHKSSSSKLDQGSDASVKKQSVVSNETHPIITITEHSPEPLFQTPNDSCHSSVQGQTDERRGDKVTQSRSTASLPRSLTDTNIKYCLEDACEIPGTLYYTTKSGDINCFAVLKAIHTVSMREGSLRVCEVVLSILEILIDVGVAGFPKDEEKENENNKENVEKITKDLATSKAQNEEDLTAHNLCMDTLIRVFKSLGCPHGCGEGHRGPPGEMLRTQGLNAFTRLHRIDGSQFRKFLQEFVDKRQLPLVLDFQHSLYGFCLDPNCSVISPLGQKRLTNSMFQDGSNQKGGYATNFGCGLGGSAKGIEGRIVSCTLKRLLTRLAGSTKELKSPENMALYCDVRQLMIYIREAHGGTFRRVALSGLLDAIDRPKKKKEAKKEFVQQSRSVEEDDASQEVGAKSPPTEELKSKDKGKSRQSLFRKKVHKVLSSSSLTGDESEGESSAHATTSTRGHRSLAPRTSFSEEDTSNPNTPKRRVSRFQLVSWLKSVKNEAAYHEEDDKDKDSLDRVVDSKSSSESLARRTSLMQGRNSRLSLKAAGHMSLGFLRARKTLGFGQRKTKRGSFEEGSVRHSQSLRHFQPPMSLCMQDPSTPLNIILQCSRAYGSDPGNKGPLGIDDGSSDAIIKEKKLINTTAVEAGMVRFSFLLETCQPGSIPDPQLIAAVLDLEAPVVARAALLLECAYFVYRCNKGNWPDWMKLHIPVFRPSGFPLHNRGQPSGFRRTTILQKAAGRMFYLWAEAIGCRLEEILASEDHSVGTVVNEVYDENKRRIYRVQDDEENFLDDATVNPPGNECPFALKVIACQLLLEITTFLRETYQFLPKAKMQRREYPWERNLNQRRCSSVLSSMGQSQMSTHSISSLVDGPPAAGHGERRISFMVTGVPGLGSLIGGHDNDNDSIHSSNTTLMVPEEEQQPGESNRGPATSGHMPSSAAGAHPVPAAGLWRLAARRVAQSRQKLLRRHHGGSTSGPSDQKASSFRRRSLRLRKKKADDKDTDAFEEGLIPLGSFRRTESIKSRKVSMAHSDRSDNSNEDHSGEDRPESPGLLSDETADSPATQGDMATQQEQEEQEYGNKMPWIKVIIQVTNTVSFACPHQYACHPDCYKRQSRSCIRLIHACRKLYGEDFLNEEIDDKLSDKDSTSRKDEVKREKSKERLHRKISTMTPGSPTRRRESSLLTATIDRKNADLLAKKVQQVTQMHKESAQQEQKVKMTSKKKTGTSEEPPILKYIKSQVQNLFHAPFSIIAKAVVIMSEEEFIDVLHVAWELLLETDQQLIAAAATVFILAAVKAPEPAVEVLTKELAHEEANERINAVFRFRILWNMRYQCWSQMEEGAHMIFKVPPPNIDFTMPSPTVGISQVTVVDPPWMPHFKTKVEEVTINQDDSFDKPRSYLTATKTRRKQQLERVHLALKAEDEKKRESREKFHMTTVPIPQRASYEPSLHHVATDEHEEGDEERIAEHQPMHHIQLAQSLFPSCLCTAIISIIHLLEDHEVNEDGVAVSEVAFKVVWNCLVDDPPLFFRHFLEKLTNKEKLPVLTMLLHKLMVHVPELPGHTAHALFNYMLGFIMFHIRSPVEGGQEAIATALSLLWQIVPSVQGVFFKDLKQTLKKEQCDAMIMLTANVPSAKKIVVHGPDLTSIPSQFPIHEDTQFCQILQDSLDFFNIEEDQQNSYVLVDAKTHQMHNPSAYVRDFYFFRRSFYPELTLLHMNPDEAFCNLQRQAFILKFVEIGKVLLADTIIQSCPANQVQNRVTLLFDELIKLPAFPRKALDTSFGMHHGEQGKELYGLDVLHKRVWVNLVSTLFKGLTGQMTSATELQLAVSVVNGNLILHSEDSSQLRLSVASLINTVRDFRTIFACNGYLLIMPTLLRIYGNHQTNTLLCNVIEWTCQQFYILHRKPFLLQMFGSVAGILDLDTESKLGDANKVQAQYFFKLLLAMEKNRNDPLDILACVAGEKPLKTLDFCYENDDNDYSVVEAVAVCVTVVAYAPESSRCLEMLTVLKAIIPYYLKHKRQETNNATKSSLASVARNEMNVVTSIATSVRAMIAACESFTRLTHRTQRMKARFSQLYNNEKRIGHPSISSYCDERRAGHPSISSSDCHHHSDCSSISDQERTFMLSPEPRSSFLSVNYSGPQRYIDKINVNSMKASRGYTNHSPQSMEMAEEDREDMHIKFVDERGRRRYEEGLEDIEAIADFRRPRDTLLCVVADFICLTSKRLKELPKLMSDPTCRIPDLLDVKAHMRLADISHALLKMSPYDPITMGCQGLQKYITQLLPITDWSQEAIRPCLIMIFRRLDKTFTKIYKKPGLRRNCDWEAAANLLKGVYLSLQKYPYIAYLPHLKFLLNICLSIALADGSSHSVGESMHSIHHSSLQACLQHAPPQVFCKAVIQLVCMQIHVTGIFQYIPSGAQLRLEMLVKALKDQYPLDSLCGGMATLSSLDKTENVLLNLIIPVCLRSGKGGKESPRIRHEDVVFTLNFTLDAILPPKSTLNQHTSNKTQHASSISDLASESHDRIPRIIRDTLFQISFLCLKVVITCFERELAAEWHKIARVVQELGNKQIGGTSLWSFIDFIVTNRSPLFVMLVPFIQQQMMRIGCESEQEYYYQNLVREKLQGRHLPPLRCHGTLLAELSKELHCLREELVTRTTDYRPRTSTIIDDSSSGATGWGLKRFTSFRDRHGERKERLSVRRTERTHSTASQGNSPPTRPPLQRDWSVQSETTGRKLSMRMRSLDRISRRTSLQEEQDSHFNEESPLVRGRAASLAYPQQISNNFKSSMTSSSFSRLTRKASLHHRRFLAKQSSVTSSKSDQDSEGGVSREPSVRSQRLDGNQQTDDPSSRARTYSDVPRGTYTRHRLQRQSAQSRKTFRRPKKLLEKSRSIEQGLQQEETEEETVAEGASDSDQATKAESSWRAPPRRAGAVMIRDRSSQGTPQSSPTTARADAYIAPMARCDSLESLHASEKAALLKDDDKGKSICIYFDEKDVEDTCV